MTYVLYDGAIEIKRFKTRKEAEAHGRKLMSETNSYNLYFIDKMKNGVKNETF